ncbi:MAG: glycosyltransferase [Clostridiales bacterium]|jgi:glycosyltransferase involved in cell wall biosynthesis|nr:glycosyltransferase [Clostridiales bacterium]
MKVLLVNKFLYYNGGAEKYFFELSERLRAMGHDVAWFGMAHEKNVPNAVKTVALTETVDFHGGRLINPLKTIYSLEAKRKIIISLNNFNPDVVHLNNFNYQLTSSIIHGVKRYAKTRKRAVKMIYTAHDYQLICPNHTLRANGANCQKCVTGNFINCLLQRCVHGSLAMSAVGSAEAYFCRLIGVYKHIDAIICPSRFMASAFKDFGARTIIKRNFITKPSVRETGRESYVLFFGRYSDEKGVKTLLDICAELPEIKFRFAGDGPLSDLITGDNIENLGFVTGKTLDSLIQRALFTVFPSEWHENCPYSVMESLNAGTPVIGSNLGGTPELIKNGETGLLFRSGDKNDLKGKIQSLWNDAALRERMSKACARSVSCSSEEYANWLVNDIYMNL